MKQVKLTGIKRFAEEECPIPKVNEDQVLIKIEICGICGSDASSYCIRS